RPPCQDGREARTRSGRGEGAGGREDDGRPGPRVREADQSEMEQRVVLSARRGRLRDRRRERAPRIERESVLHSPAALRKDDRAGPYHRLVAQLEVDIRRDPAAEDNDSWAANWRAFLLGRRRPLTSPSARLRTIDLFSGVGGLAVGFAKAAEDRGV